MSKIIYLIIGTILLLILSLSCQQQTENMLEGKWKLTESEITSYHCFEYIYL